MIHRADAMSKLLVILNYVIEGRLIQVAFAVDLDVTQPVTRKHIDDIVVGTIRPTY